MVTGSIIKPSKGHKTIFQAWYDDKNTFKGNTGSPFVKPVYFIAICTSKADLLPEINPSIFQSLNPESVKNEQQEIANLGKTIESLIIDRDAQKTGFENLQGSFQELTKEKDTLRVELTERDNLVANLGKTIESLIIDRDAQKTGFENLQGSFQELIAERNETILQLNTTVKERDNLVANLGKTIESLIIDRDAQKTGFENLQGSFQELTKEKDTLRVELTERDNLVANLGKTIESLIIDRDAQKTGFENLQGSFQELTKEKDTLRVELTERDNLVANLGKTIESLIIDRDAQKTGFENLQGSFQELTKEKDTLRVELTERDKEIEGVYKSNSWTITSPLRKISRIISKKNSVHESAINIKSLKLSEYLEKSDNKPELIKSSVKLNDDKEDFNPEILSKFRILLVSYYCPTRAHAGGLRILDIYKLIKSHCSDVQIDLLTHHRPLIDWSLDEAQNLFDNVYLSPSDELTPEILESIYGSVVKYDVVDLQFHPTGYQTDSFRKIGSKIIFTPMESLARAFYINWFSKNGNKKDYKWFNISQSFKEAYDEIGFVKKADEVVCVSQSDAAFLRIITSSHNIKGIDTGISQFEFEKALNPNFKITKAADRQCCILYIAYFGSETNVIALRWYLDNVHNLIKNKVPNYKLKVVGRGDLSTFSKYQDKSVEFIGEVPELSPYIQESCLGIAPALSGSGLRGKINQYSVLGIPSVVSPIAFKGLAYKDEVNVFVAEKPRIFANRCIQLLTDFKLNDRMGEAARNLCLSRYTWESKWNDICKIYNLEVK